MLMDTKRAKRTVIEHEITDLTIEAHHSSIDLLKSRELGTRFQSRQNECYHNCLLIAVILAEKEPDLCYVEGTLEFMGIPLDHAWLYDSQTQRIIDPTLALLPHFEDKLDAHVYVGRYFVKQTGLLTVSEQVGNHDVTLPLFLDYGGHHVH